MKSYVGMGSNRLNVVNKHRRRFSAQIEREAHNPVSPACAPRMTDAVVCAKCNRVMGLRELCGHYGKCAGKWVSE